MKSRMGEKRDVILPGANAAPLAYRLTAEFREPPALFEGCFTTFYHLSLDIGPDGVAPDARLTDYLQPEWANIRFFCGSTPDAAIGPARVTDARYVGTGPSSLPCRFTPAGLGAVLRCRCERLRQPDLRWCSAPGVRPLCRAHRCAVRSRGHARRAI
jgi:hypothetical protein